MSEKVLNGNIKLTKGTMDFIIRLAGISKEFVVKL